MCVCPSVCLFVSHDFLYMLPAAVARSFSDDNAICCVLSVLWMTLCCQWGRIKDDVVWLSSLGGSTESEVAVYDCLVSPGQNSLKFQMAA